MRFLNPNVPFGNLILGQFVQTNAGVSTINAAMNNIINVVPAVIFQNTQMVWVQVDARITKGGTLGDTILQVACLPSPGAWAFDRPLWWLSQNQAASSIVLCSMGGILRCQPAPNGNHNISIQGQSVGSNSSIAIGDLSLKVYPFNP